MEAWPATADELVETQLELGRALPAPWSPSGSVRSGACFVCFPQGSTGPGMPGDPGWAAAVILGGPSSVVTGAAGASYEAGLLALREGPLLEAAVRGLGTTPDVLLVNGTGRDHPRRGAWHSTSAPSSTSRPWALPIGPSSPEASGHRTSLARRRRSSSRAS